MANGEWIVMPVQKKDGLKVFTKKLSGGESDAKYLQSGNIRLDQYSSNQPQKKFKKSFVLKFFIHMANAYLISKTCNRYNILPNNSGWYQYWNGVVNGVFGKPCCSHRDHQPLGINGLNMNLEGTDGNSHRGNQCFRHECAHGSGHDLCLMHCGNEDCKGCNFGGSYKEIDKQFECIAQLRSCLQKELGIEENNETST
jgi:hypothetical protein